MSEKKSDQQFVHDIKQELDNSCKRLDAQTLSQLHHIRHQAIESILEEGRPVFYQRPLLSGSVLAACALVLGISYYLNIDTGNEMGIGLPELEDIEILTAEESFELYEDIEFYQWLSMNDGF